MKEIITFWPIYELRDETQVPLFLTHMRAHTHIHIYIYIYIYIYKENLNEKEKNLIENICKNLNEKEKKPHRKHLYDSLKMWLRMI